MLALGLFAAALEGGAYAVIVRSEAFVLLWWTLVLALAFTLLPRARGTRTMTISLVAWIFLAGWIALSLLWTESRERTFIELARVLGFAGVVLAVGVSFRGDEWRLAVAAVTAAAVGVCALAMTSRLAPGLFDNPLSSAGLLRRLAFPLNYWNALGCWSAMTAALSLAWSAHARSWPVRGAALAGVCLAASVVYLTYARSGTAGVVIGVVAVVGLSRHRWLAAAHALVALTGAGIIVLAVRAAPEISRGTGGDGGGTVAMIAGLVFLACPLAALLTRRAGLETRRMAPRNARVAIIVAGVLALLAAGAVGPALASRAWESFHRPTPSLTGDPVQRFATLGGTRSALWSAALQAFADHPLGGTGARHLRVRLEPGPAPGLLTSATRTRSTSRAWASSACPERSWFSRCSAACSPPPSGPRCASRTPQAPRPGPPPRCSSTASPRASTGCGSRPRSPPWRSRSVAWRPRREPGPPDPWAPAAASPRRSSRCSPSACSCPSSPPPSRCGRASGRHEPATSTRRCPPRPPRCWSRPGARPATAQRAVVLERLGLGARAAADARRAADREPTNWEHWVVLARIEAERGRIGPAVAAARRAAALNPRAPLFAAPKRPTHPRRP